MKKYISPITEENFRENWEYVSKKLITAKKKRILEKLIKIVGNLSFLFYFFVITFGALQGLQNESLTQYLNETPVLAGVWKSVGTLLISPDMHWGMKLLSYVISLYVLTIGVCAITALLFWYIYRPKLQKEITEDVATDSKSLYKMAKAASLRAGNPTEARSVLCNVIYVVAVFLYVISYVVQSVTQGFEMTADVNLMDILLSYGKIAIVALLCVGSYGVWNLILGFLLKPMYLTWIPKKLVPDAESYYYEHNEADKILIVEEERVITLAKEIKAQRKKENEELMGKGKKKDEFFKVFEFKKKRDQDTCEGAEEKL